MQSQQTVTDENQALLSKYGKKKFNRFTSLSLDTSKQPMCGVTCDVHSRERKANMKKQKQTSRLTDGTTISP